MSLKFQPKRLTEYDDNSIIKEIKRVSSEYCENRVPKIKEFNRYSMVHSGTVTKRFGSWAKAMEKAGFKYKRQIIDSQKLLKDLREIKKLNNGLYFTQDCYKKKGGKYSVKTLKQNLGYDTWDSLLKNELNLKKTSKATKIIILRPQRQLLSYTEDQLFSELKRIWDILKRRPRYVEFRKLSKISTKPYEKRFGNWSKAIEAFSLKFGYHFQGTVGLNATPEILLSELKKVATNVPTHILPFKEYKRHGGTYSIGTFINHFGSWAKAVEKIGKRPGPGHTAKYSNEELFAELQRIWEKLGRQPMFKEMRQYGNISGVIYQARFGSWIKAMHAFCLDREKDNGKSENIVIHKESLEKEEVIQDDKKIPPKEIDDSKTITEKVLIMHTARTPSLRLRFNVLKRDEFKCVKCGRSPSTCPGLTLEIDHKIPYSRGGETVLENLETLCLDCNRGKSNVF